MNPITFSTSEALPAGRAPTEFRILPKGTTTTTKGVVLFDDEAARRVLEAFRSHGVPMLPFDFEHAMANPETPPSEKVAAGWFKPEVRNGELWASAIEWTERGRKGVESKEFRFPSLWGFIDAATRRLMRLINVGLVNRPATSGQLPLVAGEGVPMMLSTTGDADLDVELARHGLTPDDARAAGALPGTREAYRTNHDFDADLARFGVSRADFEQMTAWEKRDSK